MDQGRSAGASFTPGYGPGFCVTLVGLAVERRIFGPENREVVLATTFRDSSFVNQRTSAHAAGRAAATHTRSDEESIVEGAFVAADRRLTGWRL